MSLQPTALSAIGLETEGFRSARVSRSVRCYITPQTEAIYLELEPGMLLQLPIA